MNKTHNLVADICLYGNREIGFGWLASHNADGKLAIIGDREPRAGRSCTDCVWLAVDELRAAGVKKGKIAIYAAGGEQVAYAEIGRAVPYFGQLQWQAAPMVVVSAEEIQRAATG